MDEFVAVAVITSISSKDGLLKLNFSSQNSQQISNRNFVYVDFFGNKRKIFIEKLISRGNNFFVKLKNFHNDRELEIFLNKKLFIPKKELILRDNEYLVSDLIGCKVHYKKECIGIVENVLEVPMNYVLEIRRMDNTEIMIPFVLKFFESINADKKIIYLNNESRFLYDEN